MLPDVLETSRLTLETQVTTLGQPLEVLKTQMAANRQQTMLQAIKTVWSRGGVAGFYQGLIPWVCTAHISLKLAPHIIARHGLRHQRRAPSSSSPLPRSRLLRQDGVSVPQLLVCSVAWEAALPKPMLLWVSGTSSPRCARY